MEHELLYKPSYTQVELTMDNGESISAEAGAMVSHSAGIDVKTAAKGGILGSVKRSVLGGESFFQNTFTSTENGSKLTLAPALPGDVTNYDLEGTLFVQSGSFLAADSEIDLDTKFGGGKTFFGGEGLFLLKLEGTGPVYLSSYGAIHEVELGAGESYTVDTGHIVAFEDSTDFNVRRVGGLKSTLFSGEGLVCDFTGPGRVYIQSRSPDAFLSWLIPQLPSRNSQ